MRKLSEETKGVFIIAVTPFRANGDVDFDGIDRVTDFYLERQVDGITILGIMGEAPKLTAEESRKVAERAIRRAGSVPVVVGVSSPGFAPMHDLAAAVMDLGAAGVMVAPPATVRTDDAIAGYFAAVADFLGPDIPFVLQDYPQANGVQIAPEVIVRIMNAQPTCVMLKHEDWPGLAKISALRQASDAGRMRRISILVANGGLFLAEEMERGADGVMTGFAYPEMMVGIYRAFRRGDAERGRDLFDAYLPLVRYEQQPGIGLAVRKHILAKRGAIGQATLRAPAPSLSATDIAEIERLIERQERRLAELA